MNNRNFNAEYQDAKDRQYNYNFDNIMRGYMMRTFSNYVKNYNGSVLELGCYKGEFTEILTKHFNDVSVVEASDELIDFCKNRLDKKVKFIHSTFETLDLTAKYDYIVLMHTLEHLDNPVDVLKKIKDWLSEDGILFLACPNANAPSRQIAVKMGLISHNSAITPAEKEHGHRNTYSLDTLEREAVLADLNIVSRGGVFFKPLANYQFDKLLNTDIISESYMEGCYKLGMLYPDLCASIYLICKK